MRWSLPMYPNCHIKSCDTRCSMFKSAYATFSPSMSYSVRDVKENLFEGVNLVMKPGTVKKRSGAKNVAKALIVKLFPEYLKVFTDAFGTSSVAVLTKYPSAKDIAACHPSTLAKILEASSRGRFGLDKAKSIIELAKNSIGKYSSADALSLRVFIVPRWSSE